MTDTDSESDSKQVDPEDHAGVVIRPPVLYIGTLLIGYAIDMIWPIALLGTFIQLLGGAVFLIPGLIFMRNAMQVFSDAGTSVPTPEPTTALVTEGIYQLSRNPIYLGMTCIYIGLSVFGDNIYAICLLAPVLLIMRYGVIAREEAYLEKKFGQAYLDYKEEVGRWL